MAPKAAPKTNKAIVPIEEPADKKVEPDLGPVLTELQSNDVNTQQQGLCRLFAIREYEGAKTAVSKPEVVSKLVALVTSESLENQIVSVRCLARFAAWTGPGRLSFSTAAVAETLWKAGLEGGKQTSGASAKVPSKELAEGCLRCLATLCRNSHSVAEQLSNLSMAPLAAMLQHTSPKVQERACQLAAVLATYTPSRAAVLDGCVQPLLELCNAAVAAPVMTQACYALRELTRPTGSCNAGSQLLSLDAAKVLLELLKSPAGADERSREGYECAAALLTTLIKRRPVMALTMAETGGVNLLLDLLPIPYVDPVVAAAEAAAAAAALESEASAIMSSTMSSTMSRSGRLASIKSLAGSSKSIKGVRDTPRIPSPVEVIDYSTKPGSPSVQKALLHVLAAVLQNVEARTALLALDAAVGKVHKPEIVPMLVNLLATETPEIAEAAVAQTPTAGKGAAAGKVDPKGKPSGKAKPDPAAPLTIPPRELLPAFPAEVQLAAVQCLREAAMEPAAASQMLQSAMLKHVAKFIVTATDQSAEQCAVMLQCMALNNTAAQLLAVDEIRPLMRSLAAFSLKSGSKYLQAAVGYFACSLPPAMLLPDVRPPLPTPPATPAPPPLPLSKFVWEEMDYDHPVIPTQ